jgi:hypothetical protein
VPKKIKFYISIFFCEKENVLIRPNVTGGGGGKNTVSVLKLGSGPRTGNILGQMFQWILAAKHAPPPHFLHPLWSERCTIPYTPLLNALQSIKTNDPRLLVSLQIWIKSGALDPPPDGRDVGTKKIFFPFFFICWSPSVGRGRLGG